VAAVSTVEVEGEVVAEEDAGGVDADPVRQLPERYEQSQVPVLRSDVRNAALAAAGGALAGVATVAAVRAVSAVGSRRRPSRRSSRRPERPANVVASRSFLVDVHLLG
jgi:hypothetical protein